MTAADNVYLDILRRMTPDQKVAAIHTLRRTAWDLKAARLAASLAGIMFLLWVLLLWAPALIAVPGSGSDWTNTFVTLAMSGGAFVLAAEQQSSGRSSNTARGA